MNKVMIDTNIILDVFLEREPFYEASAKVLNLVYDQLITGAIPASCITDIYYIARKISHNKEKSYKAIELVTRILEICDVTSDMIHSAFEINADDFEDCILAECAKANSCDYIITRYGKDFSGFDISCITPENFIKIMP